MGLLRLQRYADSLPDRSPQLRATGDGMMNIVNISCGAFANWGFARLQNQRVPLNIIFSIFASAAIISIILVLCIRPHNTESFPSLP